MHIIRNICNLNEHARNNVLALGNFDGLHCGHMAVLNQAKQFARKHHLKLAVMTFEPHPRRLFKPDLPPLRILPMAEKLRNLRDFGVNNIFILRFNHDFAAISAHDFIADILHEKLAISALVTGDNFIFGHNRQGNSKLLQQAASEYGFTYMPVPAVKLGNDNCSSTRLRGALASGDMELATKLLGRPYYMTGRVIRGDSRGNKLGFPTANLQPSKLFYPAYGIYVTRVHLLQNSKPPRIYNAVSSFGIRPMYKLPNPLLENHIIDFNHNIYERKIKVEFLHYIRPEKNFANIEELKTNIANDIKQAKIWLHNNSCCNYGGE